MEYRQIGLCSGIIHYVWRIVQAFRQKRNMNEKKSRLSPNVFGSQERVFKSLMAAGNAESVTNGVTGVGGIEIQTRVFRDSNVDSKFTHFGFSIHSHRSLRLRCVPGCHFLFFALEYVEFEYSCLTPAWRRRVARVRNVVPILPFPRRPWQQNGHDKSHKATGRY